MSLRVRLSLLITLLFIAVLSAGSIYAINSARIAVKEEMQSAAQLTSNVLEVSIATIQSSGDLDLRDHLLNELVNLEAARHLRVIINFNSGIGSGLPLRPTSPVNSEAPTWFVELVEPPIMEFKRVITSTGAQGTEIIIRADPSAEITEAWYETRNFLLLLFLFTALSNLLIYFILGRDLAPIEAILSGLERIERGDYKLRLPEFNTMEFSRISARFNHLAAVLLKNRDENRRLTRRSLEIQEKERRHLAQELHDELGQSLSAIKAIATSIEQTGAADGQTVVESAKVIKTISDDMYGVARGMIRQLRPTVLDELGLVLALQQLADDWNSAHADTFCHLDVEGDWSGLADAVKINIYRIIQESLTNVARHAEAKDVYISLNNKHPGGDGLVLEINDDGTGFDREETRTGMGLPGIQERVDSMGGEFQLETGENKGVNITIILPMQSIETTDV